MLTGIFDARATCSGSRSDPASQRAEWNSAALRLDGHIESAGWGQIVVAVRRAWRLWARGLQERAAEAVEAAGPAQKSGPRVCCGASREVEARAGWATTSRRS